MSRYLLPSALCLLPFLLACGKNETSSTVDLVKTIATESRTKPRVEVSVKLNGEQPVPEDLALQKTIEDRIEQAHIGRLISSGSNAGYLSITVEVDNTADAIAKLRTILQNAGALNRSSFKVKSED
jgi:hypothetical protein